MSDPKPPCKYCGSDWLTEHTDDCPTVKIRRALAENTELRAEVERLRAEVAEVAAVSDGRCS